MARTYRVAVLECDETIESVKRVRGTYSDIFHDLLSRGLKSLGAQDIHLDVSRWDVVRDQIYPGLESFDGLLVSGSKHCAFGDEPWIVSLIDYIQGVMGQSHKPVVGICFGHQIIARALGSRVGVSPGGWEISVDCVNLSEHGQKLLGVPAVNLHQMHRDSVLEVPDGVFSLGHSPACEIQGLFKPGRVLSVQAHPEFDDFIMTSIVQRRYDQGIFDDDMFQDGMRRSARQHDGVLISRAIWHFFLGTHDTWLREAEGLQGKHRTPYSGGNT